MRVMTPKGKQTLLLHFVKHDESEEVVFLVREGALIYDFDKNGNTPLHYSLMNRNHILSLTLYNHISSTSSSSFRIWKWLNNDGYSILHFAIIYRCPFIELLFHDNNHELNTRDGKSCYDLAIEFYPEVSELIYTLTYIV